MGALVAFSTFDDQRIRPRNQLMAGPVAQQTEILLVHLTNLGHPLPLEPLAAKSHREAHLPACAWVVSSNRCRRLLPHFILIRRFVFLGWLSREPLEQLSTASCWRSMILAGKTLLHARLPIALSETQLISRYRRDLRGPAVSHRSFHHCPGDRAVDVS
jgi:hypothetical protein